MSDSAIEKTGANLVQRDQDTIEPQESTRSIFGGILGGFLDVGVGVSTGVTTDIKINNDNTNTNTNKNEINITWPNQNVNPSQECSNQCTAKWNEYGPRYQECMNEYTAKLNEYTNCISGCSSKNGSKTEGSDAAKTYYSSEIDLF